MQSNVEGSLLAGDVNELQGVNTVLIENLSCSRVHISELRHDVARDLRGSVRLSIESFWLASAPIHDIDLGKKGGETSGFLANGVPVFSDCGLLKGVADPADLLKPVASAIPLHTVT